MANNELALKFTEEYYATRHDVARDLRMSIIDSIWANILSYRHLYRKEISLTSIENHNFSICYCNRISSIIKQFQDGLLKLNSSYLAIDDQLESERFINASKKDSFDSILKTLTNEFSVNSRNILENYGSCLSFIKDNPTENINSNYLFTLLAILLKQPISSISYRTLDDKNSNNQILIDRLYTSAPARLIEEKMNALFHFVNETETNVLDKALIACYYIQYIRPFPSCNDEMAILTLKSILANSKLKNIAAYFPFETILNLNSEVYSKILNEVQKTGDITYFYQHVLLQFNSKVLALNDLIISNHISSLKEEMYQEDDDNSIIEPIINEKIELPVVEKPVQVAPQIYEEELIENRIAISHLPSVLNERQAKRLEIDLLESDPLISKKEAKFYARHCTLGKQYTIAQFKKSINCVYETARTSMDHLAKLGYYRKQTVKNKFVYVPIPR